MREEEELHEVRKALDHPEQVCAAAFPGEAGMQ